MARIDTQGLEERGSNTDLEPDGRGDNSGSSMRTKGRLGSGFPNTPD